jgi:hypothetical protein
MKDLTGYFARISDGETWGRAEIVAQLSPTHYLVHYFGGSRDLPTDLSRPANIVTLDHMAGDEEWCIFETRDAMENYIAWLDSDLMEEIVPVRGTH